MLDEPTPVKSPVRHEILWLGEIDKYFEVEIRADRKTNGWLYEGGSLIFYKHNDRLYECWLYQLKELTETCMKDKVFKPNRQEDDANYMVRDVTGKITGYLSMTDVLNISNELKQYK